jgi:hypothetical protein
VNRLTGSSANQVARHGKSTAGQTSPIRVISRDCALTPRAGRRFACNVSVLLIFKMPSWETVLAHPPLVVQP